MRKIALLAFGLLLASPAYAVDNTLLVTPCASGCITTKSKDIGAGVQAPQPVISDTGGNPLATPTAGADGASNTSTGLQIYARPSWWNGVTWDRAPGDVTNGAFVNVKTSVLPTGAATSAAQTTAQTSLSSIDTKADRVVTWAGGTLGAMANYGTSPGAVLVPGANVFVTNSNTNVGNNADAVASGGSAGSPVVNYNYGYNGTTWDRLQVDGSKQLKTVVATTTNAGATTVKGGVGVVNGGSFYQAVAASQTATVLQSSTGAIGDYLSHCVLYPTSTSPGVVTVFDNTNAAAGSAILFPGGATSLSNLAPISIPVGAVSTAGAWKVTTGASISVVCYGKFS